MALPHQHYLFLHQKIANGAVHPRREGQRSQLRAQQTTERLVGERIQLLRCRRPVTRSGLQQRGSGAPDSNGLVERATTHSPFTIFHFPLTIFQFFHHGRRILRHHHPGRHIPSDHAARADHAAAANRHPFDDQTLHADKDIILNHNRRMGAGQKILGPRCRGEGMKVGMDLWNWAAKSTLRLCAVPGFLLCSGREIVCMCPLFLKQ